MTRFTIFILLLILAYDNKGQENSIYGFNSGSDVTGLELNKINVKTTQVKKMGSYSFNKSNQEFPINTKKGLYYIHSYPADGKSVNFITIDIINDTIIDKFNKRGRFSEMQYDCINDKYIGLQHSSIKKNVTLVEVKKDTVKEIGVLFSELEYSFVTGTSTFDPKSDSYYIKINSLNNDEAFLLTINSATGAVKNKKNIPSELFEFEFNCKDNQLYAYGLDSINDSVYIYHYTDTNITRIHKTSFIAVSAPNATIDPITNTFILYGVTKMNPNMSIWELGFFPLDSNTTDSVRYKQLNELNIFQYFKAPSVCTPDANFKFEGVCLNDTTYFTFMGLEAGHFRWDFDDTASGISNESNDIHPFHVFSDTGTYNVKLTTQGCVGQSDTVIEVKIYEKPEIDIPPFIELCPYKPSIITPTGRWEKLSIERGNDMVKLIGDTTLIVRMKDEEKIILKAQNKGCSILDTSYLTSILNEIKLTDNISGPSKICQEVKMVKFINDSEQKNGIWKVENAEIIKKNDSIIVLSALNKNNIQLRYELIDSSNCELSYIEKEINVVNNISSPKINGIDSICLNDKTIYTFSLDSQDSTNYQWTYLNDGVVIDSGLNYLKMDLGKTKSYRHQLIVNSILDKTTFYCLPVSDTFNFFVAHNNQSIMGDSIICDFNKASFKLTLSFADNITWKLNGETAQKSKPSIKFNIDSGLYGSIEVYAQEIYSFGCLNNYKKHIYIENINNIIDLKNTHICDSFYQDTILFKRSSVIDYILNENIHSYSFINDTLFYYSILFNDSLEFNSNIFTVKKTQNCNVNEQKKVTFDLYDPMISVVTTDFSSENRIKIAYNANQDDRNYSKIDMFWNNSDNQQTIKLNVLENPLVINDVDTDASINKFQLGYKNKCNRIVYSDWHDLIKLTPNNKQLIWTSYKKNGIEPQGMQYKLQEIIDEEIIQEKKINSSLNIIRFYENNIKPNYKYRISGELPNGEITYSNIVDIESFIDIFIPNAMSENWNIEGLDKYPYHKIMVFNRWGKKVYTNEGNRYQPWDGTSNGTKLMFATYYYIIDVVSDQKYTFTGDITIFDR